MALPPASSPNSALKGIPAASASGHQHLRSASMGLLIFREPNHDSSESLAGPLADTIAAADTLVMSKS